MQCMIIWNSFKQNPTQKFCKNLINFEKHQKIYKKKKKKTQNLGQNAWNVWLKARKEIILVKNAMKRPKNE